MAARPDETVPGGVYETAPDSGEFVDANGNPVTPEALAEFRKLQAEWAKVAEKQEAELTRQSMANMRFVVASAPTNVAGIMPTVATDPQPVADDKADDYRSFADDKTTDNKKK